MTNKSSSDFEFDLAKSLKVKSECLGGLPIYDFLLVVKYNIRKPTMLWDMSGWAPNIWLSVSGQI